MSIRNVFSVYILLIIGSLPAVLAAQAPVLNEIVSLNETGLQDSDGDHPDWIELFNPSDEPIELIGYTLTDDDDNEAHWVLPDLLLPPGGYTVIFASGKDRADIEEPHTNFSVSADGEWVYLYNPQGGLVDQVSVPPMAQDQAFGRSPDGGQTWSRLDIPTPWGSNDGSNHLEFSHAQGFYAEPFSFSASSLSGDTIFYTLDGSIPTYSSEFYDGPLSVKDRSGEANVISEIPTTGENMTSERMWVSPGQPVAKATVLRFASYRAGKRTSTVNTLTFFVGSTTGKYTLPVVSLVTDAANLFDYDSGIYVPGQHYDPDNPYWSGNSFQRGDAWERDVHISYFPTDGPAAFAQDAGVRIHGGGSRDGAQKSLRLYARKDYGTQYFDYPLMPHRGISRYKRFILRATMGTWEGQTMIADEVAQSISANLNLEYQDSRPAIVFINGEYWGIHAIRDRIDDRYLEYVTGMDRDSVQFREDDFESNEAYQELLDFAESHDLSLAANYEAISQLMDVDNFIDYQIAEQFFRNYDWPANNLDAWKKTSPDGRWRWIFFDVDAGFGTPDFNMLLHATRNDPLVTYPNPPWSTALFRSLLENDNFRRQFITRYAEILNEDFRKDKTVETFEVIRSTYAPEVSEHIERWHYPNSYGSWVADVGEDIRLFLEERPCFTEGHVLEFFDLNEFAFSCINNTPEDEHAEIVLAPNPNLGAFSLYNTTDHDRKNSSITVFDIKGAVLYKTSGITISAGDYVSIDIGTPAGGVYIAEILSDQVVDRVKFVVADFRP